MSNAVKFDNTFHLIKIYLQILISATFVFITVSENENLSERQLRISKIRSFN